MKFSVLIAILANDLEEKAVKAAKDAGAEGVTILAARGVGATEKKTFFGLTYEGSQSVMLFVLERKLSVAVLKSMSKELELGTKHTGVVFTVPLEHITGIDMTQLQRFEQRIKDEI